MTLTIKACTMNDLDALQAISVKTFTDTFAESNTEEDMALFLNESYSHSAISKELMDPQCTFYFVMDEGNVVGYMKTTVFDDYLEIGRIYVIANQKGKGIGKFMVSFAKDKARELSKDTITLGVWEHNINAQAFYKKMDFKQIGTKDFILGTDTQIDYIMALKVN